MSNKYTEQELIRAVVFNTVMNMLYFFVLDEKNRDILKNVNADDSQEILLHKIGQITVAQFMGPIGEHYRQMGEAGGTADFVRCQNNAMEAVKELMGQWEKNTMH